jgi:cysteinyl-tRNA synthetase
MTVEGRRMGKSEGNAYLLEDLIKRGYDPLAFRYLCLNTHYRSPLNFTWQALEGAQTALERLREHVRNARELGGDPAQGKIPPAVHQAFLEAINDDLNIPQALGVTWEFVRSHQNPSDKLAVLFDFDRVFGLKLSEVRPEEPVEVPAEVRELVAQREAARKAKNFQEADALRAKIAHLGYDVIDTPQGPKLRRR